MKYDFCNSIPASLGARKMAASEGKSEIHFRQGESCRGYADAKKATR